MGKSKRNPTKTWQVDVTQDFTFVLTKACRIKAWLYNVGTKITFGIY